MSTLGVSPTTFTLDKGYGSTGSIVFNSTYASNKIIMLSYIDITRGWEWMHVLRQLQNDVAASTVASNVEIMAVVFNYYYSDPTVSETYGFNTYSGNISRDWILDKINNDSTLSGINFTILVDATWTAPSPAAINIIDDYSGATDSPRPAIGTFWFTGMTDKNFKVSDKWQYNTTPNAVATSFNHISGLSFSSFQSNSTTNNYENARAFILQRIQNLIDPPFIIDTHPKENANVNTLNQTKVFFSKPINMTEAETVSNYLLNGGGFSGAEHPSIVLHPTSNAENVSTLTITNALNDTVPAITVTMTGLHDTTPAAAIPPGPLPLVTAGGANVLDLIADVTPPSFSAFTLTSGTPTSNPDITFDLTATDNVGVTAWLVNESSTPPSASGTGWTAVPTTTSLTVTGGTYSLSGGLGTKHVYAWAKDAAGNVSAVNANSHFDVVFDSELPQTTAFTRSSASPTKNSVVSFHLEGSDNIGIVQWKVTENNTKPSSGSSGWTIVATTTSLSINGTYTLTSQSTSRTQTLYVWLGDGAGNVSDENGTSHFDVVYDVTVPVVTAFTLTSANPTNNQTITFNLEANDPM